MGVQQTLCNNRKRANSQKYSKDGFQKLWTKVDTAVWGAHCASLLVSEKVDENG
jgi:hypothetical protein